MTMIFKKSAQYYDALYSFKDYASESEMIRSLIAKNKKSEGTTLLDVACGTGHHISLLRGSFQCEGVDLSQELLAIARERNPGVPFHHGNMEDFDLHKQFDVVTCLFSAIGYLPDTAALDRAVANMARHLKPGGVFLLEPWFTPDRFKTGAVHAVFVDTPEMKIARMNVSEVIDGQSRLHFHYMVATTDGIETFIEDHRVTLFTEEQYVHAIEKAELAYEHDPLGLMERGLFTAWK